MARFHTVLKSARFVYSPYTAIEMQGFAQVLADSIRARIQSGQNIYDQAAAPLKPGLPGRRGYPDYKTARGLRPVRDWTWSGHTLRCLKVLTANENRAAIGFQMQGTLGIESNAAQPLYLNRPVTVGDVKGYVEAAPTGSGITFTIYVGGAAWLTLTIPTGQTAVVATPSQISALSQIPANTPVSIGTTAVGTTFPGANLSVFTYS